MQVIDGRKIRDQILSELSVRVASLSFVPMFCDVLVGNDPASAQYVAMKERVAKSLGIETFGAHFTDDITTEDLIVELKKISALPRMAGLIIQLPLPAHLDTRAILDAVPWKIDVDATSTVVSQKFYDNNPVFVFPTASAVLAVLDSLSEDFSSKKITMVGRGMLVGAPVAHLLKGRGFSVDVIDHSTPNTEGLLKEADVVITATGQAGLIRGDMLKPGVVVIDAGTSESNGGISGDVDTVSLEGVARAISPVPGGVGPVTVAMLMQNVVISAERLAKKAL